MEQVLVTGGSGRLGSEFKKILPNAIFPTSKEFDITNFEQMCNYISGNKYHSIVHCSAFTDVSKSEHDSSMNALEINIIGTANVTKLCSKLNIKLIYISTDYIFDGETGNYDENSHLKPINKYAWTKLGGECAVKTYDNHVIIRTTFGPNDFPHPKAFIDKFSSCEPVSIIASKIKKILYSDFLGTIHIGGNRKSVYEYAKLVNPDKNIGKISIKDVPVNLPKDTSLNCQLYNKNFQ